MIEPTVQKITPLDQLHAFYNTHYEKYVGHKINARMFGGMPKDDIVQTFVQPGPVEGMPGVERKIKAKDKATTEAKARDNQLHILRIINELIKEEKNGKTDTI